jgi:hypothetical protein
MKLSGATAVGIRTAKLRESGEEAQLLDQALVFLRFDLHT